MRIQAKVAILEFGFFMTKLRALTDARPLSIDIWPSNTGDDDYFVVSAHVDGKTIASSRGDNLLEAIQKHVSELGMDE